MKKVLIITYYWPPAGGPGVQRVLKFAKYLPSFGWEPVVLTVKNGEYPALDATLEKEVPKGCTVYRTPSIEPFGLYKKFTGAQSGETIPVGVLTQEGVNWKKKVAGWARLNLFVPDARIGWLPYAVRKGKAIISREKPALIFSSSPPHTVQLIAKKLAKWSKLPWVADFRDPWTGIYHYDEAPKGMLSNRLDKYFENQVLTSADRITAVSPGFFNTKIKMIRLPNGYDYEDLDRINTSSNNRRFTIRYMGSLKIRQYVDSFFTVLEELSWIKEYLNNFQFDIIGQVDPLVIEYIRKKSIRFPVKIHGYLDHEKAVRLIANADMLVHIVGRSRNSRAVVGGKLFEYLMVQKPVLAYGPVDGQASQILQETGLGRMFDYENKESARAFILENYNDWKFGTTDSHIKKDNIEKYERKQLTRKLAYIFEEQI